MKHPTEKYKGSGSGWCPIPYCKNGAKWFTCGKCGVACCGHHQIFDLDVRGPPVIACANCMPELWDFHKHEIKIIEVIINERKYVKRS